MRVRKLVDLLKAFAEHLSSESADELLANAKHWKTVEVTGITQDSRTIESGNIFFALAGETVSGEQFIDSAISHGACAVFCSTSELPGIAVGEVRGVPVFRVPNLAALLSYFASAFYDFQSSDVVPIAITGTNGKTSVAMMLAQAYAAMGIQSGVIGTLGFGIFVEGRAKLDKTGFTTPQAIDTQRYLRKLADEGCRQVVMEVSSHALAQHRVDAVPFRVAVLTNITRDHLDFHGDMASYIDAKARLLAFNSLSAVVINLDDSNAASLIERVVDIPVFSYSLTDSRATVYACDMRYTDSGVLATLRINEQPFALSLPLLGEFNLSNSLAVCSVLLAEGHSPTAIIAAFTSIQPIEGRMQRVLPKSGESDIHVVVDFAHTPDALAAALAALRQHTTARLVCVFGCGGDRDQGKRPEMGAVAENGADKIYLTSDNPRNEPPEAIIEQIQSGMKSDSLVEVVMDRGQAIHRAIAEAHAGDMVLLAGKGHETTQSIGLDVIPFSDYQVAQAALHARMAA